uniref:Uncharacterized protein n=1 Tax=Streptomyces sp. NBC_00003 TaxID=2903608 RepID=A0AAU2VDE6_9ACTN
MSDAEGTEVAAGPEAPPARRRRAVRRRGGYMPTGLLATEMAVPPASVTMSDEPAVPAPETQDVDDGRGAK